MPQYVRGIDALGVPLSTEQRELLYKAFVASTNRNEFNYVKFASAIDARIASHRAQTMKAWSPWGGQSREVMQASPQVGCLHRSGPGGCRRWAEAIGCSSGDGGH